MDDGGSDQDLHDLCCPIISGLDCEGMGMHGEEDDDMAGDFLLPNQAHAGSLHALLQGGTGPGQYASSLKLS